MAKQMIEVRPGQAAIPGHVIEVNSFGRAFAYMTQRPADAIIAGSAHFVQPRGAVAPVRKPVSDVETKIENQLLKLVMPVCKDPPSAAPRRRGADRSRG